MAGEVDNFADIFDNIGLNDTSRLNNPSNSASLGFIKELQAPFFPREPARGPTFLDTEACLCQREFRPDNPRELWWRCIGDRTQNGTATVSREKILRTSGKWFEPSHDDDVSSNDVLGLPLYDASNPPARDRASQWNNETSELVPGIDKLSVWDRACTGENRTSFSTSFYRAVAQTNADEAPVDAAPCWRPGAVPLQLQGVSDWMDNGCKLGFQCVNNTVNSLPQFCPPFALCQMARLGGRACELDGKNIGMGPFEPVVCQRGYYCPTGGRETIKCPKGTYCQPGAATPTPCAVGSLCPAGSSSEKFLIPVGVLILVDILLIIGIILLRFRDGLANSMHGHQSKIPKQKQNITVGNLARALTRRQPYKRLSDDHEAGDHEMRAMNAMTGPRRDIWAGFQGALDRPPQAYKDDETLSPEIQAFVNSMRKATDASNIGLSFGYENLAFQPKSGDKFILQNITGCIRAGSLTAVMGGSGAGKSTFVNVLMGKTQYTHGSVRVNGVPGKLKRYKKLIGYVPQDDVVLPELTVYENIMHSARVRLPPTWKDKDIKNHVEAVIDCLELSHVSNSLVGSVGKPVISGGQRKRVSIGMELAAAPMAIFLDEPTSGLDATSASSIMRTLKAIARLGMTVITIIHQPRMEIFEMLDDLLLLGNGQQLYEGPEDGVRPFFEKMGFSFPQHANFGDVVTDIITGNGRPYKKSGDISKEALIANWAASRAHLQGGIGTPDSSRPGTPDSGTPTTVSEGSTLHVPGENNKSKKRLSNISVISKLEGMGSHNTSINRLLKKRGASRLKQFRLCLSRAMLQQYRSLSSLWFELGLALLAGFLLGIAKSSKSGILFAGTYHAPYEIISTASDFKSAPELALLTAIAIGLVAAAPGVKVFSEEMLLHRREAEAGHSRLAYFMAKSVSVVPRMTLACLHFTMPLLLLSSPIIPWGIAFLTNLDYFYCIFGLASAISMVVKREDAPLFATMIALITGILSGAAPPLSKVKGWKMEWLWRSSPGVWLAEIYFGQLVSPLAYLYDVDLAARATGFTLVRLWLNLGVLLGIGTIYRILAFVGLFAGKKLRV
ncbi:hypothetical protein QBC38DRAFT_26928 [Podospora fimiseda]|uniref:ABC transporter domain-containing protein n=1 Tax=Podospora fimiseda TaxID=252190 RepID=A0AAN7BIF2_9PEZI|nr:hypothetical protein QBC38DRAFT_26928 [Podospora fimiseda]